MPGVVKHALVATTPDDPAYEIRPSHWNNTHAVTLNAVGSELTGAFSNSNGLSFGLEGGGAITGSYTVPSTAGLLSNIKLSAGTLSQLRSDVTFSNANGVSFGLETNGVVTASIGAGGAPGSISAGTTRFALGEAVFSNSNGISFGLNGATVTASHNGISNVNVSAGTTSNNLSNVVFSNSNNVSFGLNGSTVTATATVVSTQGSINLSAGTTSNLASAFTFSNSNGVSFGLNASTITASVATSLTNILVSAGTTSNLRSNITFSNVNGVSFGLNAGTITASHNGLTSQSTNFLAITLGGNTAGTTTFHATNNQTIWLNGGANVTLSGNGSTITISAAAGGGGGAPTLSRWMNLIIGPGDTDNFGEAGVSFATSNATLMLIPLVPGQNLFPGNMTVSTAFIKMSGNHSVATASTAAKTYRVSLGIYTQVNSTQLSLLNSVSTSFGTGAAASNQTASYHGQRYISIHSSDWSAQPSFSQTLYYLGYWIRSSGESFALSWFGARPPYHGAQFSGTMGISSATNTSRGHFPWAGAYSVSFTTAMPNTIGPSEINKNAGSAGGFPMIIFENYASVF